MPTRADIIGEARTWVGTKWRHQGRLKGVSVDCAGLVIETGKAVGCIPCDGSADKTDYGRQPDPLRMRAALNDQMDHVEKSKRLPGDVIWLRAYTQPQHLGILATFPDGRLSMIHAPLNSRVIETALDEKWEKKLVAVFRYRGLLDG